MDKDEDPYNLQFTRIQGESKVEGATWKRSTLDYTQPIKMKKHNIDKK